MKVLILDEESRLFLAHQGQWTDSAQEARDFAFTLHATAVARSLNLSKFQVLFFFPDIDYKILVATSPVTQPSK